MFEENSKDDQQTENYNFSFISSTFMFNFFWKEAGNYFLFKVLAKLDDYKQNKDTKEPSPTPTDILERSQVQGACVCP